MQCYSCQNEIQLKGTPRRTEVCPQCQAYLHCCWNCRFFNAGKHNQCSEPQAEYQSDKAAANFCEYWEARTDSSSRDPESAQKKARDSFDQLFRR